MRRTGAKECPAAEPSACPAQSWAPLVRSPLCRPTMEATKDAAEASSPDHCHERRRLTGSFKASLRRGLRPALTAPSRCAPDWERRRSYRRARERGSIQRTGEPKSPSTPSKTLTSWASSGRSCRAAGELHGTSGVEQGIDRGQ